MKKTVVIPVLLISWILYGQPSEAEIRKQLTNENTIEIKFTKTTGTRQWNSGTGNWEYVRGVIMKQKSFEYPQYKVNIGGDAVYQYIGASKYSYWKFRTLYQYFEGIPNPTINEITNELSKDWKKFYGGKFYQITKLIEPPALAPEPGWIWHDPKSVSFKMVYKADIISGNIFLETRNEECEVRFYRDEIKGPWNRLVISTTNSNVLDKKTYSPDEIKKLEQQSLGYKQDEQEAGKAAAALPTVVIPEFSDFQQMADYLHDVLRNGNPKQLEAVLIQLLVPTLYLNPGSKVQVNAKGAALINTASQNAYLGNKKYKDQYCIKYEKGRLSSAKHLYIQGCLPKTTTLISGIQITDGYIDGKPQSKWKITNLDITVRQDDDAINYLNSFSDPKKLCPKD